MTTTNTTVRLGIAVAVGLLAAACTGLPGSSGPPSPSTAADSTSSSPAGTGRTAPKPAGDTKTIVLGDLDTSVDAAAVGAPFDPCKIEWSAFPGPVRPVDDRKPLLRAPGANDPFATACRFDNSEKAVIAKDPKDTKPGRNFIALVVWAKPGAISADPNSPEHQGSTPTTFAGKPGLLKPGTNTESKEPMCTGIVALATGTGGVVVTNGAFPDIDTCSIAKAVTEAIASKTP